MKRIRDESGQTLILVAVCLTGILGFVGFATDVGVLLHAKRNLQIAADAAAIAGANEIRIDSTQVVAAAKAASAQNGFTDGANGTTVNIYPPPVDGPNINKAGYVEAIVRQPQPTFFMRLFSFTSMPVAARAVAFNGASSGFGCLTALNQNSAAAIDLQGHFTVDAPGCQVIDDSKDPCALQFTGNAGSLIAGSVGVVGPSLGGSQGVCGFPTDSSPLPVTGVPQTSDPLVNTYQPLTAAQKGTCAAPPSGSTWGNSGGTVLADGSKVFCYSSDISIANTVTMLPGTYVFTGSLGLQGHGQLQGNSVTIYLAAPSGNMNMGGAGNATLGPLSAPSSGPFTNVVIYQEPADINPVDMTGTPISNLSGIIYLPSAQLILGGNGNLSQDLNVDLVVNKFKDFGNATVNITDFSATHNTVLHTIALVE
jgi:Putative Flp pilus-assembly TadE/G-like